MNFIDIIIGLALIYALYKGFHEGVVVQLCGIAAVIIGVWLAYVYCNTFGLWLKFDAEIAAAAGFIMIFIGAVLLIGMTGWLLGKVFDFVGLGIFNKVLGVALSIFKMVVILSVLIAAFDYVNKKTELVKPQSLENSALYKPIGRVAGYIFPYVTFMKNKIAPDE